MTKSIKNPEIVLKKTEVSDLETLFQIQLDEEGGYLAAFTAKDHDNKAAYINKYTSFLENPTINNQTIWFENTIVGSVAKFIMDDKTEVTYWIDRKYWGKGIATKALKEMLKMIAVRPIYGRVAFDNLGSQKVLENCGFVKIGTDRGFANFRQEEIEEFIYKFDL